MDIHFQLKPNMYHTDGFRKYTDKKCIYLQKKIHHKYYHRKKQRHIQRIVGSFQYYNRTINNTIYPDLNEIVSTQSTPTYKTRDATIMLIDYVYTHSEDTIRYHASNI